MSQSEGAANASLIGRCGCRTRSETRRRRFERPTTIWQLENELKGCENCQIVSKQNAKQATFVMHWNTFSLYKWKRRITCEKRANCAHTGSSLVGLAGLGRHSMHRHSMILSMAWHGPAACGRHCCVCVCVCEAAPVDRNRTLKTNLLDRCVKWNEIRERVTIGPIEPDDKINALWALQDFKTNQDRRFE